MQCIYIDQQSERIKIEDINFEIFGFAITQISVPLNNMVHDSMNH